MSTDDSRGNAVDFADSRLAETFVALADTLVADFDVFELLDRLVSASVGLLDAEALKPQARRRTFPASGHA